MVWVGKAAWTWITVGGVVWAALLCQVTAMLLDVATYFAPPMLFVWT